LLSSNPQGLTKLQAKQNPQGLTKLQPKQNPQGLTKLQPKQNPQGLTRLQPKQNPQGLTKLQPKQNPQGLTRLQAKQNLEGLSGGLQQHQNLEGLQLNKLISQQFSNLFNSYTKSFNKYYHRRGSLFVPNFKHKEITSHDYLLQLILYIHNNPVKHGFTSVQADWKFSSFNEIVDSSETFVSKQEVISLFENTDNFMYAHHQKENLIKDLMMEE
jgi:hypothetical protein